MEKVLCYLAVTGDQTPPASIQGMSGRGPESVRAVGGSGEEQANGSRPGVRVRAGGHTLGKAQTLAHPGQVGTPGESMT